jgi:hypothetical protein
MATPMECSSSEKTDTKQQAFVVISWNVLHMVHEINYVYDNSPVINRYSIKENWSNEKRRLNDMVKTISDLLVKHSMMECFICLQEVPGDLLPLINQMLDSHVGSTLVTKPLMYVQTYTRKPHIRGRQGGSVYTDPNESLVTIHYNPYTASNNEVTRSNREKCQPTGDRLLWTPCPSDNGKGALAVITASGLTVVNAHVPYDNQAAMSLLNNIAWPENDSAFVFVGDMNRYSDKFMRMIGEVTAGKRSSGLLSSVTTNKATRVGLRQDGVLDKSWIDYFVISACLKHAPISPAIVHDEIGDVSDHYPIVLSFKGI